MPEQQSFRKFRRTDRFIKSWKKYIKNNPPIKKQAESALRKFASNPRIPDLRIKKIQGTDSLWELSVNMDVRIVWYPDDDTAVLLDIGPHDILEKY